MSKYFEQRHSRERSDSPGPSWRRSRKEDKELKRKLKKLQKSLRSLDDADQLSGYSLQYSPVRNSEPRSPSEEYNFDIYDELFTSDLFEKDDSTNTADNNPGQSNFTSNNEPTCSKTRDDILALLGEDGPPNKMHGPPIYPDLVSRWERIISEGVSESKAKELIRKYPAPENCKKLAPPILNTELLKVVSAGVQRRDDRILFKQNQSAAALSAVGLAITSLLKEEGEWKKHCIPLLSDAGRLIANMMYSETQTRRELLALNFEQPLKEKMMRQAATNQLFGDNLGKKVNIAKKTGKGARLTLEHPTAKKRNNFNFRGRPGHVQGGKSTRGQSSWYRDRYHNNQPSNQYYEEFESHPADFRGGSPIFD